MTDKIFKYLGEILFTVVIVIITTWIGFVTIVSYFSTEHLYNHQLETQSEPVLIYHNNHIYIDQVKTEYTLKEISKGVYVIRKGEGK